MTDNATLALIEARIVATAKDHGDRYLLPRRYRRLPLNPPDALDLEYEACERLVARFEARWLPFHPNGPGPGIEVFRRGTGLLG